MATRQLVRSKSNGTRVRSQRSSRGDASDPTIRNVKAALKPAIATLRKLARYKLEPRIDQLMLDLGERKEFLDKQEHSLLLGLVAFWQDRMVESLEARVALQRLRRAVPELVNGK